VIGQVVTLVGAALVLVAGIGVVRFRDPMSRLHALTKASTLGVVLVFLGAAMYLDRPNDWTSLLLAAALQLLTSPISAALISRSTILTEHDGLALPERAGPEDGDHGSRGVEGLDC
jgi:multicomponent Na+:H+ antiporter subunit G